MYDTGNAGFISAACSSSRVIDSRVTLTLKNRAVELNYDDISSYKIVKASTTGDSFTPGNFVKGQLSLKLVADSPKVQSINFKTEPLERVSVRAGIAVNDAMVFVPMGQYYLEEDGIKIGTDGYISLTLSDNPSILNTKFSSESLNLPCSVGEAIKEMAKDLKLNLTANWSDFPNSEILLQETFSMYTTYREAFMYAAESLGAYLTMGRNGEILLRKTYNGLVDTGCLIDEDVFFNLTKQESTVKPYQHISIKANKDDLGVTTDISGITTECTYTILDNPLTYGHPEDFLKGLISPTTFTPFYPSKIVMSGRPDFDTGDVINYSYKGITYMLPICIHTFEYNGGFKSTLESVGSDELEVSSSDSGVKSKITAIKQNINSLIRELDKTQSQIIQIEGNITEISTILQTVDEIKSQVSAIEGDLEKVSTLTQTSEEFKIQLQTIVKNLESTDGKVNNSQELLSSYFDFLPDGLVIGMSDFDLKLKLSPKKIQFLRDGYHEVAYFSGGKLYVTDAQFLNSLIIGSFALVPRTNGNLSMIRRKNEDGQRTLQ